MTDGLALRRGLLVFGLSVPVALGVGYMLAMPLDTLNLGLLGTLTLLIASPILLRWHHALLVSTWNAAVVFPLSPQPRIWVIFAAISLGISLLAHMLNKKNKLLFIPSVALPLLLLAAVMAVTGRLTGGFGGGDMWGQKRYFTTFTAILGFFALSALAIPKSRRMLFSLLFIGAGITSVIPDLLYLGGPEFYFLYSIFETDIVAAQVLSVDEMVRYTGFAVGGQAACWLLLMHYGIRGLCDLRRWWRLLLFLVSFGFSLLGGYRSVVVLDAIIILVLFFYEGLFRTRFIFIFLLAGIMSLTLLVSFGDRMPLSVQRTLSVLPIELDSSARRNAEATAEWRWEIWKLVIPQIPRYFWLGKGYAFSGTDSYLTIEAVSRGLASGADAILISGYYHSGPLTLIIPFGIFGVLAFTWFCVSGFSILYQNYRFGDPDIKKVNVFLISFYSARLLFFLSVYGQFDVDLYTFTGLVGFSIALNGGVVRPKSIADALAGADATVDSSSVVPGIVSANS